MPSRWQYANDRPLLNLYDGRMKRLQSLIAKNILLSMKSQKPAISLNKLAVEADIDKSTLWKVLHGERRMNVEQIERIATILSIDPVNLFKK